MISVSSNSPNAGTLQKLVSFVSGRIACKPAHWLSKFSMTQDRGKARLLGWLNRGKVRDDWFWKVWIYLETRRWLKFCRFALNIERYLNFPMFSKALPYHRLMFQHFSFQNISCSWYLFFKLFFFKGKASYNLAQA